MTAPVTHTVLSPTPGGSLSWQGAGTFGLEGGQSR